MASRMSVLVVEDEPLLRFDIIDILTEAGFDVHEASNAAEAINVLMEHEDIRLVFTDVDMPGRMDGIKLAAYIRDRWPPLKIIVTSGYRKVALEEIPAESRFFSKPYDTQKVVHTIREMLAH